MSSASAALLVHIDRSSQHMDVVVDGVMRFRWPVSTGRRGLASAQAPNPV